MGVCSASTKECVVHLLHQVLGAQRVSQLSVLLAGDDVPLKKPHPMIYALAAEQLNIPAQQ